MRAFLWEMFVSPWKILGAACLFMALGIAVNLASETLGTLLLVISMGFFVVGMVSHVYSVLARFASEDGWKTTLILAAIVVAVVFVFMPWRSE